MTRHFFAQITKCSLMSKNLLNKTLQRIVYSHYYVICMCMFYAIYVLKTNNQEISFFCTIYIAPWKSKTNSASTDVL